MLAGAPLLASLLATAGAALVPINLRVDRLLAEHALGIDSPSPVFSWDLSAASGSSVHALHVLVATEERMLTNNNGPSEGKLGWWRMPTGGWGYSEITNRGARDAIIAVRFGGDALRSSTKYHWRVCLQNQEVSCSEISSFVTGLVPSNEVAPFSSDWQAKWVGGNSKAYPTPCTHCMAAYHAWCQAKEQGPRCGFQGVQLRSPVMKIGATAKTKPKAKVKLAVIHATSVGMHELYLNGKRVADSVLEPGFSTNFTERLLYSTYDVTKMVQSELETQQLQLQGGNDATSSTSVVLAARVGAGKYSLGEGGDDNNTPPWGLLVELRVTMENENENENDISHSDSISNFTFGTSKAWAVSDSPIVSENLYVGEVYDARLEQQGWNSVGKVIQDITYEENFIL